MNGCGLVEIIMALPLALLLGSCVATAPVGPADRDGKADRGVSVAGLGAPVDVEFRASLDQSTQRYVKMLPKGFDSRKPHDLLIALHGQGSDRWQYVKEDRGECRGARDVAARHGLIFVSPDYRGPMAGMNSQAEADLLQIIALMRQEYKIGKVFLAGGSMGGVSVLLFAASHPELVHGVVSANGTALANTRVDKGCLSRNETVNAAW